MGVQCCKRAHQRLIIAPQLMPIGQELVGGISGIHLVVQERPGQTSDEDMHLQASKKQVRVVHGFDRAVHECKRGGCRSGVCKLS